MFTKFIVIVFSISFAMQINAIDKNRIVEHKLYQKEELNSIELSASKNFGYMLIHLNIERNSVLKIYKKNSMRFAKKLNNLKKRRPIINESRFFKVNKGQKGYYFIQLYEGIYQISAVEVPFYNYPYIQDYNNRRDFQFIIKRNRTNYVGHLEIKKERGIDFLLIKFRNRMATSLSDMHKQLNSVFSTVPLASGIGYKDDFYSLLESNLEK